ncbi:hypothetical protein J4209_05000 [Candidatus Woesearchaeota archaeon]|nr:hypothetical protein [Candidatus Woesearchaeota archaeon]
MNNKITAKGLFHVHSEYSADSNLKLIDIKRNSNGFNFFILCEHEYGLTRKKFADFLNDCKSHSNKGCLFIPGIEIKIGNSHLLLIGNISFEDYLHLKNKKRVNKKDTLLVWAHPEENEIKEISSFLPFLDGIELWNLLHDGTFVFPVKKLRLLRRLKKSNENIKAFIGSDLHNFEFFKKQSLVLSVKRLAIEDVINKIKKGEFFSESGNFKVLGNGSVEFKGKPIAKLPHLTLLSCLYKLYRRLIQLVINISGGILDFLGIKGKVRKRLIIIFRNSFGDY